MNEKINSETPPISDQDFAFKMGLKKSPYSWLRLNSSSEILNERKSILDRHKQAILFTHNSLPLIQELSNVLKIQDSTADEETILKNIGEIWEPDFIILKNEPGEADPTMVASVVCFPSFWTPSEKIGHSVLYSHSVVPGLNSKLGDQISRFLSKCREDEIYERWNWNLVATTDLNMHPKRNLPKLESTTPSEKIYIRWEHQGFLVLPQTSGVVFMVRIITAPLSEILNDDSKKEALRNQISTMPQEITEYKKLYEAKDYLLNLLK